MHKDEPVGYAAKHYAGNARAVPLHLLTEKEFQDLISKCEHPFKWAPGLISNDMSSEEFLETIESARKKIVKK